MLLGRHWTSGWRRRQVIAQVERVVIDVLEVTRAGFVSNWYELAVARYGDAATGEWIQP